MHLHCLKNEQQSYSKYGPPSTAQQLPISYIYFILESIFGINSNNYYYFIFIIITLN
jgi:hypothetical protein